MAKHYLYSTIDDLKKNEIFKHLARVQATFDDQDPALPDVASRSPIHAVAWIIIVAGANKDRTQNIIDHLNTLSQFKSESLTVEKLHELIGATNWDKLIKTCKQGSSGGAFKVDFTLLNKKHLKTFKENMKKVSGNLLKALTANDLLRVAAPGKDAIIKTTVMEKVKWFKKFKEKRITAEWQEKTGKETQENSETLCAWQVPEGGYTLPHELYELLGKMEQHDKKTLGNISLLSGSKAGKPEVYIDISELDNQSGEKAFKASQRMLRVNLGIYKAFNDVQDIPFNPVYCLLNTDARLDIKGSEVIQQQYLGQPKSIISEKTTPTMVIIKPSAVLYPVTGIQIKFSNGNCFSEETNSNYFIELITRDAPPLLCCAVTCKAIDIANGWLEGKNPTQKITKNQTSQSDTEGNETGKGKEKVENTDDNNPGHHKVQESNITLYRSGPTKGEYFNKLAIKFQNKLMLFQFCRQVWGERIEGQEHPKFANGHRLFSNQFCYVVDISEKLKEYRVFIPAELFIPKGRFFFYSNDKTTYRLRVAFPDTTTRGNFEALMKDNNRSLIDEHRDNNEENYCFMSYLSDSKLASEPLTEKYNKTVRFDASLLEKSDHNKPNMGFSSYVK